MHCKRTKKVPFKTIASQNDRKHPFQTDITNDICYNYCANVCHCFSSKFFFRISNLDSSDFNELLWIATDFNLVEFKDALEKFLMETNKVNLKFEFDVDKLNVLKLADNYGLTELRSWLLKGENITKSEVTRSEEFLTLTHSSRFEILRNTFIFLFVHSFSKRRQAWIG